ncbi:hypothetical protein PF008_g32054 [Phytophthora fragariae]|uniref:Uncharacterized protein n=1 Tax=Phytophthora fragariae TaxID=53985 RepID=A0A6G0Q119_9STRA|nr:hypothetical protein PF008_g32054 [Phytophthora fragariae]
MTPIVAAWRRTSARTVFSHIVTGIESSSPLNFVSFNDFTFSRTTMGRAGALSSAQLLATVRPASTSVDVRPCPAPPVFVMPAPARAASPPPRTAPVSSPRWSPPLPPA